MYTPHAPADSHSFKASSLVFNTPMSGKAQAALLQTFSPDRSKTAYLQLRALGGAVDDVGVEETAFPHRKATFEIQVQSRPPLVHIYCWIVVCRRALKHAPVFL